MVGAVNASPDHELHRRWLDRLVSSDEAFGYSELVLSGFVRVTADRGFARYPDLRWVHPADDI